MPNDPLSQVEAILRGLKDRVETNLDVWMASRTPSKFRQMEQDIHALMRGVADELSGMILVAMSKDPEFQAKTVVAAHAGSAGSLRGAGHRTVKVKLLGGSEVAVKVAYLTPRQRKSKKRVRRRRRTGRGLYPMLAALGIWFGVTPALAGELCRQVADSDSVRTGREALDRRGIDLGHKQTLCIVNRFGRRAVEQRERWLLDAMDRKPSTGILRDKRVVVETDGGRIRERVVKRGRRNKRTGHHRYDAPWREPKLLTIYVIDEHGDVEQSFRPILDGTLGDCDVIFAILAGYLRALGAHEARELIFLGDGARWIWDRTGQLAEMVGLPLDRVTETVDWYHAVETLHEVADVRARWPRAERERWLKRAKKALFAGTIDELMQLFDEIAVGRRARGINKHRDYFRRNTGRMQYAAFKTAQLPLGSGAVESGIRRVINMRMKANGTFWLRENAEAMLLLRGYLKAGRFDDLVDWSIAKAAAWWPGSQDGSSPVVDQLKSRS